MRTRLKTTAYATILALGLSSLGSAVQAGSLAVPAVATGPKGITADQSLVQQVDHRDRRYGKRHHGKRHYYKKHRRHGWRHHHRRHHRHGRRDNDVGIALGAAGLILGLGALAATSQARPRYAPAPSYHYGSPRPWTRAWYEYCSAKYRSFEPATGYYTTYSGYKRFCQ